MLFSLKVFMIDQTDWKIDLKGLKMIFYYDKMEKIKQDERNI